MLLSQLPVVHEERLKWHPGLYRAGTRAPSAWTASMPRMPLDVYRLWPLVSYVVVYPVGGVCLRPSSFLARFCLY